MTGQGDFRKEWGIRDQIRRSALSVPSNIAEGTARGSSRDSVRFYIFARGSLAELYTQADIASAVGLLDDSTAKAWERECLELGAMLTRLIASVSPPVASVDDSPPPTTYQRPPPTTND